MEETKLCPYCKEEIKAEAVKCKHCSEFLNSNKNQLSVNSNLIIEYTIQPQRFNFAIILGVISIILSFFDVFNDIEYSSRISWKITLYSGISYIWLWFCFRKYLKNFKSTRAINITNWIIVISIFSFLLEIFTKAIPDTSYADEWQDTDNLSVGILVFWIITIIVSVIVYIKAGIIYQKIKNDSVGLLKQFGMSVAFLLPFVILIYFIGTVLENDIISLIATAIDNIPTIIMILIFIRAKKK